MSARVPVASWDRDGLFRTLAIGALRAEVCPNADKSGWLYTIKVRGGRSTSPVIARAFVSEISPEQAQCLAEDVLRTLAADITRILGATEDLYPGVHDRHAEGCDREDCRCP